MKIAVGLSGGVDSSVAALLLKEQGHEVIAMFMQNWHDTTGTLFGDCPWKEDYLVASLVAKKLDIPFYYIDLSHKYSEKVVDYMFNEYSKGRTPNPDILCNREIKFDVFLNEAFALGVEAVATGHYCRKSQFKDEFGVTHYSLLAGRDPNKDQSYFLCQLTQDQLSKSLFPIGDLLKSEVRDLASRADLPTADKKDSQGICFVGKIDLPTFLKQKILPKDGDVIEIYPDQLPNREIFSQITHETLVESSKPFDFSSIKGKIIGKHQGANYYTIGQRKGLNIGGHKESIFVLATDIEKNIIYVGEGHNHPGLMRDTIFIRKEECHWLDNFDMLDNLTHKDFMVRIRYRQPLESATLYVYEEGIYIKFKSQQRGVTPGQFAAWYEGEKLLGSGVINY